MNSPCTKLEGCNPSLMGRPTSRRMFHWLLKSRSFERLKTTTNIQEPAWSTPLNTASPTASSKLPLPPMQTHPPTHTHTLSASTSSSFLGRARLSRPSPVGELAGGDERTSQATWCQRMSTRRWPRSRPSAPSSSSIGAVEGSFSGVELIVYFWGT